MAASNEDRRRFPIPRWHSMPAAIETGELQPLQEIAPVRIDVESDLAAKIKAWEESPGRAIAADCVASAIVGGRLEDVGMQLEMLSVVRSQDEALSGRLASHLLSGNAQLLDPPQSPRHQVRALRRAIARYPRDAIAWLELARMNTASGATRRASRAVETAVALAPDSRFVLRSAARYFIHIDDPLRGYHLLSKAPNVRTDPWILAAEIATSGLVEKSSTNIRTAKRMLERDAFRPQHLSELASAMGTLETIAGAGRKARGLIRRSLLAPTENAIAQAAWWQRQGIELGVDDELVKSAPRSFEAAAWGALERNDWEEALHSSEWWLHDEPFSSRPALLGSFIAATGMGDFETAAILAKRGLSADPTDAGLKNNLAYALACDGDPGGAERALAGINEAELQPHQRITVMATRGCIQYAKGQPEMGSALYVAAVEAALRQGHVELASIAKAHWALEELKRDPQSGMALALEAMRELETNNKTDGARMVRARLNRMIESLTNSLSD